MSNYSNLKEIKEVYNQGDVNRLLKEGWKLLNIYNAPDPYVAKAQCATYVMGFMVEPWPKSEIAEPDDPYSHYDENDSL